MGMLDATTGGGAGGGMLDAFAVDQATQLPKKHKRGGLFGIHMPKLGLGEAAKEIGGAFYGLADIAAQPLIMGIGAATHNDQAIEESKHVLSHAGRGFLQSMVGTGATIAGAVPGANLGKSVTDWGAKNLGEEWRPHTLGDITRTRGLVPGLIEEGANVAIAAGAAEKLGQLGEVGRVAEATRAAETAAKGGATVEDLARAKEAAQQGRFKGFFGTGMAGDLKEAGRALAKADKAGVVDPAAVADRVRLLNRLETVKHSAPVLGLNKVVPPLLKAAGERVMQVASEDALEAPSGEPAPPRGRANTPEGTPAPVEDVTEPPGGAPTMPDTAGPIEQASRLRHSVGAPDWATHLVERLPAPAVKALAGVNSLVHMREVNGVIREQTRAQGIDRRVILRSSPAWDTAKAGAEHLVGQVLPDGTKVTPELADHLIGDTIMARLDATEALQFLVGAGASEDVKNAVRQALVEVGARSAQAIPAEWLTQDGTATPLGTAVDNAVQHYRDVEAQAKLDTLRSTRKGNKGLERVGTKVPQMSVGAQRLLHQAVSDLDFAQKLRETVVPKEVAKATRQIAAFGDSVSKLSTRITQLEEQRQGAIAAFDRSRRYVAPAFRTDESWAASIDQMTKNVMDKGGATFNPHEGRLIAPIGDGGTDGGFSVGVVPGSAKTVELTGAPHTNAVLIAQTIDEVARAYQDLYQNRNVHLAAWVDGNTLHVDPSEIVATRDEALLKGAARRQATVYDMSKPSGEGASYPQPLGRPDVSAQFLDRNNQRMRFAKELRRATEKSAGITEADIDAQMAVEDILAVSQHAAQPERFTHPDMVYATKRAAMRAAGGAIADNPAALLEERVRERYVSKVPEAAALQELHDLAGQSPHDVAMGALHDLAGQSPHDVAMGALHDLATPDTLENRINNKVLGAMVKGDRNTLVFFRSADPVTLVHENAHALRQILSTEDMATLENSYGVKGGKWTRAHEERFATDFEKYLATAEAPTKGLAGYFARVKNTLARVYSTIRGTSVVSSDVRALFDKWLNPAEIAVDDAALMPKVPEPETGTMRQRAVRNPNVPEGGSPNLYRRGVQGGEAIAQEEAINARIGELAGRRAQLEKQLNDVKSVLIQDRLPAQLMADKIESRAQRRLDRFGERMENPSLSNAPVEYGPVWGALKSLHAAAVENPDLAAALEDADLPNRFSTVLRLAKDQGFDPVHIRSFQPSEVRRLVYDAVRLGKGDLGQAVEAGTRKARRNPFPATRSFSALRGALVEATHELHSNAIADYIEEVWAKPVEGGVIPKGGVGWDAERSFLRTGERTAEGTTKVEGLSGAPTKWIPAEVKRSLDTFTKDYDHGLWRMLRKSTDPWRTLILTLSPKWVANIFAGHTIMAAASGGARFQDFAAAWRDYRADNLGPMDSAATTGGISNEFRSGHIIPEGAGPKPFTQEWRDAIKEAPGVKGKVDTALAPIRRAASVVDEIGRVAVFRGALRRGMTDLQALEHVRRTLVDYNDLSPFERQVVRSIVPFYSWQKGVLSIVSRVAVDNPAATGVLMQLGLLNKELQKQEYGTELPDYYAGLMKLPGVGNVNTSAINPFREAGQLLTPQDIAASMNPFLQIALRNAYGAPKDGYVQEYRVDSFGNKVPDTSPARDIGEVFTGVPLGRLGTGLTGGGGNRSSAQAVGSFAGAQTYTPEQVQNIIDKVLRNEGIKQPTA